MATSTDYRNVLRGNRVAVLTLAKEMGYVLGEQVGDDPSQPESWCLLSKTQYATIATAQRFLDGLAKRNGWEVWVAPPEPVKTTGKVQCSAWKTCKEECGAKVAHDTSSCEPCPFGGGICHPIEEVSSDES